MYKVILADDHRMVREGLKLILMADTEIEVVGEAGDGLEVLELLDKGIKPDLILSDISMPGLDGMELLKKMQVKWPGLKVVILSMKEDLKTIKEAVSLGACGYMQKDIDIDEFLFTVKQIIKGRKYISPELAFKVFSRIPVVVEAVPTVDAKQELVWNNREIQLLTYVGQGLSNQQIGEKMFISSRTVEGQRTILLQKTGAKNTAALIKYAVLNKLIY